MHRIDTPTAQVDKFGAGKNGFTRGNPQTGVPSTALDDDYFDAIQEEIAGVIESTGVPLNKNNRAQLLAAINTIIANGGANFLKKTNNLSEIKAAGPAAVEQTLTNIGLTGIGIGLPNMVDIANFDWQNFVFTSGANYVTTYNTWVNPPAGITYNAGTRVSIRVIYISNIAAGPRMGLEITPDTSSAANFKVYKLLCVGAAGSRVFTFNQDWNSANKIPASGTDVATNAEMQVGTADKLVSLVGLMSIFGKRTFSENDYIRIPDVPGGLIIQWMKINNFPANAFQTVTLPTAMPHQLLNVVSTMYYGSLSASAEANARVTDFTLTNFRAAAGLSYTTSQTFIAIGY